MIFYIIFRACDDLVEMCEAFEIKHEETGIDLDVIAKNAEGFKGKVEAKKMEIEKAKKSQKKDIVRVSFLVFLTCFGV